MKELYIIIDRIRIALKCQHVYITINSRSDLEVLVRWVPVMRYVRSYEFSMVFSTDELNTTDQEYTINKFIHKARENYEFKGVQE